MRDNTHLTQRTAAFKASLMLALQYSGYQHRVVDQASPIALAQLIKPAERIKSIFL